MLPYIHTPFGDLPSYSLMAVFGMLLFFAVLHVELRQRRSRESEEAYICPRVVAAGIVAFASAVLLDAVFKAIEYGTVRLAGATFYGGLIGACGSMYIFLSHAEKVTGLTRAEWFDLLTAPLICFHICGRVGCFMAGCCYGMDTDSFFGVVFPDNPRAGIYHYGVPCYPAQLIEAASLALILVVVLKSRHRFETYLLCYAVARFAIEFIRGDDRGMLIGPLSPAQGVSIVIIIAALLHVAWLLNVRRVGCRENALPVDSETHNPRWQRNDRRVEPREKPESL